jgi:hypothetical protein
VSYKSREKKRRAKIAVARARVENSDVIKSRHYLTIVSRQCCCNAPGCNRTLRKGDEAVFRFEPKEILCGVCAELRGLRPRPSRRWERWRKQRRRAAR